MNDRRKKYFVLRPGYLLTLMAIGTVSLPVIAQEPVSRHRVLEEVTVTARKVEESLQETPVSVAVFSQDELQQMGVSEAGDIARYTPSLEMRKQTASGDRYAIGIRGVFTGDAVLTVDPTVGIYQDGVYLARTAGSAFDIVDLERVEVLRGPQGALFGRNTIGGAINLITAKPSGELGGRLSASFGDRDYYKYQASIDSPEVAGVSAKFSMMGTAQDGPLKSIYNGDTLGDTSAQAYRLAVRWMPNEALTADYVYSKSDRESSTAMRQIFLVRPLQTAAGGPYMQNVAAMADRGRLERLPIPDSDPDAVNSDIDSHALTLEWSINDALQIKSITSYRDWESYAPVTDFGSFPADGATLLDLTGKYSGTGFPGMVPAGVLVPVFDAERDSAQDQWTQELQFTGQLLDGRLNYVAGLFYFEEHGEEFNPQYYVVPDLGSRVLGFGTSFVLAAPYFDYSNDVTSYAAYSQIGYELTSKLEVSIGLRYSVDDKETTLTNTLDGELKTVTGDDTWNNFNPSVTLAYQWNDTLNSYAKIATGYRSGGYNVRAKTEATFLDPADEETVVSYELGLKADLLDATLRLNSAIFYMDYDDRQISQFVASETGGASTNIVNAGRSTTTGLELESVWLPTDSFKILFNYGYLKLEYDEFITTPVDPTTGLEVGSSNVDIADIAITNLYTPEHSGSIALEYQFDPFSIGQLTLRLDATYTDDMSFDSQINLVESEAHTVINARATLAAIPAGPTGELTVAAWVTNLADEEFVEFVTDFGQLGSVTGKYSIPRTWGMDISYKF